jgi:hypothetical protein
MSFKQTKRWRDFVDAARKRILASAGGADWLKENEGKRKKNPCLST